MSPGSCVLSGYVGVYLGKVSSPEDLSTALCRSCSLRCHGIKIARFHFQASHRRHINAIPGNSSWFELFEDTACQEALPAVRTIQIRA